MNRFIWQYIFTFVFIVWVLISYTHYDDFTANFIRIVGVFLVFVGIIGRIYATIFIGGMKNEGVDGSKFIDYGAYSICRNPLYLFSFIAFLGLLAIKAQIILLIIGALFFLIIYHYTIKQEERFLSSKFGQAYLEFLEKTARFFPNFSNFYCPDRIEVRPEFLHKELRRAINWALGLFVLCFVELLHHFAYLPNLFYLF